MDWNDKEHSWVWESNLIDEVADLYMDMRGYNVSSPNIWDIEKIIDDWFEDEDRRAKLVSRVVEECERLFKKYSENDKG